MPNRGPRKILDVNAPKRNKLKTGPKPKPKPNPLLVDPAAYVPPPRKKPKIRYTNEQIIEVLQFLYYHRILEKKPDGRIGEKLARYRSGTILQKSPELFQAPEGHRYRSPTYEEAADWFQIPKSTVSTWWNTKLEMIGIKPEVVPRAPMPDFLLHRPPAAGQPAQPAEPIPGAVPIANGLPAANPVQAPDTMQGVVSTAQGAVPAAGPQVAAPVDGQPDVIAQPETADGSPAIKNQPASDSSEQGAAEVAGRASNSPADDTPTPTPSEQLADVANFNEEVSDLNKEMDSSEDDEEEEDEDEVL
ncbi:hypothetical protein CONLIGDRAFT_649276 [Coniochaeta ligniaria NRRL 30616]|uniref:Uncharacterized protein n=1 Tax=Coniochaeta ligniaria NRRL 30616 TaxID=1408157 RepID=A0A1J7J8V7_9PEZI|nr:hypothetical protein CONLIGDRAFT_649276 [Coniochaeta ligniaria NRRL 30616]